MTSELLQKLARRGVKNTGYDSEAEYTAPRSIDEIRRRWSLAGDLADAVPPAKCGPCDAGLRVTLKPLPPLPTEPIRNLYFHLCPLIGRHAGQFHNGGMWRENLQQLAKRWHLFNGRRLVYVATGAGTYEFDVVAKEFAGLDCELHQVRNNRAKREIASLPLALRELHTADTDQITLVCHSKGVTHPQDEAALLWMRAMWELSCDCPDVVRDLLSVHPIAGSFRKRGGFNGLAGNRNWHYSGSFYWLRHAHLWRHGYAVENFWAGLETFPGRNFDYAASGLIFCDSPGNLYHLHTWQRGLLGRLDKWKQQQNQSASNSAAAQSRGPDS